MGRGDGPGRPPLDVPARLIRITLSLRPGEDDDLLAFFVPVAGRRSGAGGGDGAAAGWGRGNGRWAALRRS